MTVPLRTIAREYAWAREQAGYPAADELLQDLRGAHGDSARAVAVGYVMAVHDSNADYLDGATLLKYLQGRGGESERLAGMGYVMAARDGIGATKGSSDASPSRDSRTRLQDDTEKVKSWLERNAWACGRLAYDAARLALEAAPRSAGPRHSSANLGTRIFAWFTAQPALAKGMSVAALCLASVLGWQSFQTSPSARNRAFEQTVELSQRASSVTALLLEQRRFEKDLFINIADRDQIAFYAKKWDEARVSMAETVDRIGRLDLSQPDQRSIREIESDFQAYVAGYSRVLSEIRSGQIRTAQDANRQLAVYKGAAHRIEANGAAINARAVQRLGGMT